MLIMTGYYQFPVTAEDLRNATVFSSRTFSRIGALDEKNGWNAKVHIQDVEWKMSGAVGVLSDKFGYWYILNLVVAGDSLSFELASDHRPDRRCFSMEKKGEQYWGEAITTNLPGEKPLTVNCVIAEAPGLFIPSYDIPDDMLMPPTNLH